MSLSPHRAHSPVKEIDKQQLKYYIITVIAKICASHYQSTHTKKRFRGQRTLPHEVIIERAI